MWISEDTNLSLKWETAGTLTHCAQSKMADIFQMTFSNTFSWMKYDQIAKFMGPTWGPPGSHVGPMNLAIRCCLLATGFLYLLVTASPEHGVSAQPSSPAPQSWLAYPRGLPPWTPPHCDMAGCWEINYILANIRCKHSIRILNQYPFLWNISIWV